MSDTAKGPLAGYLYQFEKGLLLLAGLEAENDYITIEEYDDISTHDENGTVIFTIQAKHSIAGSGSTFEDTSYSLWRTLQIWIEKLESKTFTTSTTFVCATNKTIPDNSLLRIIKTKDFKDLLKTINELLEKQKLKLTAKELEAKKAPSIKKIISLIEFVLSKQNFFEQIKNALVIEDNESIKEKFMIKMHLNSEKFSDVAKDTIYHTFYGWLTMSSKASWNHSSIAKFTQKQFTEQWAIINSSSTITNSVFRAKNVLGSLPEDKISEMGSELFVKQIEDIPRRAQAKEQIIKKAIQDFIFSELEEAHIVKKGDFTEIDFLEFKALCKDAWEKEFNRQIIKELDEYDDDEKNTLAIKLFDIIMNDTQISFKDGYSFTTHNEYLRNGNFLKLSNEPCIGWHPNWESKYVSGS